MLSADIVQAARDGDPKAIEKLIRLCQPDVRRYAQRSCSNAADAEDAVQHVTIIIYQHLGTLRAVEAFSQWLKTIIRRECLRLARLILNRSEPIEAIVDDKRYALIPTDQLRIELVEAIGSLPAAYREVVILRDFEGLTMAQIANRVGITVENTKTRIHRARYLLREYMTQ